MEKSDIEKLAIKFFDQITDGDGFTLFDGEIQKLVDAGYITKTLPRGHYVMTDKLCDLIKSL